MQPFKTHTGIVSLLDRGNIDTDQIISKEFLKSIKKTGFGEHLFHHWRYQEDGKPKADFGLNHPATQGASILLTGNNFGCGSSREHAVWAVLQFGFKVVIAPRKENGGNVIPGFADIFKNNSTKNGLLLIELSEEENEKLKKIIRDKPGTKATINLEKQTIQCEKLSLSFEIDSGVKERLLKGLDDIGLTEKYLKDIKAFEQKHNTQLF